MHNLFTIKDFLIVPLLLLVAYAISTHIKNKNIDTQPFYKYFRIGLFIKIFAGLFFSAIYLIYYGGGDTVHYFLGSESIIKMLGKSFPTFIKLMQGDLSPEVFSMFDRATGWPSYFRDPNSFAVCRYNTLFYVLGLGSYLGNTIIMNVILYIGIWRFYKMLVTIYPENEKLLAIAIFFIPSVVFWSSGILKDGWTLTAILFIYTNFYNIFILKNKVISNILWLLFWSYVSFSIRPYIFYATIGSGAVWIGFSAIQSIKSVFLRTIALPFILILTWTLGALIIIKTGALAGNRYSSIDAMVETAWVIQDDLKKDYYGGNSFDIGSFEPTIPGVLSKAPEAIVAGLFRPFLWEGKRSVLMLLSGLESLLLFIMIAYVLFKYRIFKFLHALLNDSLILSLFVLAITFAFSIGLTTANFGALVRYAIPAKILIVIVLNHLIYKAKSKKIEIS